MGRRQKDTCSKPTPRRRARSAEEREPERAARGHLAYPHPYQRPMAREVYPRRAHEFSKKGRFFARRAAGHTRCPQVEGAIIHDATLAKLEPRRAARIPQVHRRPVLHAEESAAAGTKLDTQRKPPRLTIRINLDTDRLRGCFVRRAARPEQVPDPSAQAALFGKVGTPPDPVFETEAVDVNAGIVAIVIGRAFHPQGGVTGDVKVGDTAHTWCDRRPRVLRCAAILALRALAKGAPSADRRAKRSTGPRHPQRKRQTQLDLTHVVPHTLDLRGSETPAVAAMSPVRIVLRLPRGSGSVVLREVIIGGAVFAIDDDIQRGELARRARLSAACRIGIGGKKRQPPGPDDDKAIAGPVEHVEIPPNKAATRCKRGVRRADVGRRQGQE